MALRTIFQFVAAITLLWLAGFAFYAGSSLLMKDDAPGKTTDAIVVLTGDNRRIETGLALLAQGLSKHFFVSGVYKDVKEQEIRQMWKGEPPLPACCIALGRTAKSTIQNGQETAQWIKAMKFSSVRLVTSSYHMHRAVMELSHAAPGLTIVRSPVTDPAAGPATFRLWQLLFLEYNKTLARSFLFLANVFPAKAR